MAKRKRDPNAPKIGVIYARYSSVNQREESIEQQIAECREYAEQQGITIVDVYADAAQSGRSDKRQSYQKLLTDAQRCGFNCILAYKSSRISRNMVDAMVFEAQMMRLGISVLYAKEEFGNNAAGRFALRSMMNINQFYSENLSEDIRRAKDAAARECKSNGIVPYGFRKGADGKLEIDEETAAVVREIFRRVRCGDNYIDIANDLNARGLKTRQGNPWNKGSFHIMLKSERYIGVYTYKDLRIEGGNPAIIDRETFMEVQKIVADKTRIRGRKRSQAEYTLTGKLFCGKCKAHMTGMSGTGKMGEVYRYYSCVTRRDGGGCDKEHVQKDYVERKVAEAVREYVLRDDVIEWMIKVVLDFQAKLDFTTEIGLLEQEIADTDKSIANLLKAIEQGILTETTRERMYSLEEEKKNLKTKLATAKAMNITVTAEKIREYLDSFRKGEAEDPEYQSRLFDAFLTAVYLYDNKLKIVFDMYDGTGKSLDIDLLDRPAEETGAVSLKLPYAPEYGSGANSVTITMIQGVFVLVTSFHSHE